MNYLWVIDTNEQTHTQIGEEREQHRTTHGTVGLCACVSVSVCVCETLENHKRSVSSYTR